MGLSRLGGDHDLGAILSRFQSDLLADAATSSRDKDDPTGELSEEERSTA